MQNKKDLQRKGEEEIKFRVGGGDWGERGRAHPIDLGIEGGVFERRDELRVRESWGISFGVKRN